MTKPTNTAKNASKETTESAPLDTTKEIAQMESAPATAPETTTALAAVDENAYALLLAALEGNPDDTAFGEDFGGSHERLELAIEEWSKPVAFVRFETITTATDDNGDATESFKVPLCRFVVGANPDLSFKLGGLVALPAAATLKRCLKDGEVGVGDVFRFKRNADVAKKSGKGKGQMMEVYGIRVLSRG